MGFKVGDKVKCLHPTIVLKDFRGEVGEVIRLKLDEEFSQTVEICYGGCTQIAYPKLDGVALVEEVEMQKPPTDLTAEGYTPKDKPDFQVGDRVVCRTPTVVSSNYRDKVGRIVALDIDFDGEQTFTILFGDGCTQDAYADEDGVELVERKEKTPTESTAGAYTPKDIVELLSVSEDNVNSPSHYGQGEIEAIVYIKDFLTEEEYIGYLRGNIAKYLHRWRYKNGLEDLKKAQVYLGWLIDEVGNG